ncbi:MAG: HD domain-containing phosphohydrolase [Planctomycetota bacterium]
MLAPTPDGAPSGKIMIVDDEEFNILVVRRFLREAGYSEFVTIVDPTEAVDTARYESPDILLLDIVMPGLSGLEVLRQLKSNPQLSQIPVIILTASSEQPVKLEALELGATDFLAKPVDPSELRLRVKNTLTIKAQQDYLANYSTALEEEVRQRTAELEDSRREVVHCLARAAESRDEQTGHHIVRVGLYAGVIAEQLGYCRRDVEMLKLAALLHDVGKIGVPDAILRKPGKLAPLEFEVMKGHCDLGSSIIRPLPVGGSSGASPASPGHASPLMRLAAVIAESHHEKWDGTGYPKGLKGEAIPMEGRIVAVADVFDALTNKRPYKKALPLEETLEIMEQSRGTHFDPIVLDAFLSRLPDVIRVSDKYSD